MGNMVQKRQRKETEDLRWFFLHKAESEKEEKDRINARQTTKADTPLPIFYIQYIYIFVYLIPT